MGQGIKKISENIISPGRSLTIVNNSIRDNTNFQIGTLKCYPNPGNEYAGLRFKSGENEYSLFDASNILEKYTIEENLMNINSVSTRCIIDSNVTTNKIHDLNITNKKIENKSETTGIIAYEKIKDGTIKTCSLGNESVTNEKVKNKNINAGEKILNSSITTELLIGGVNENGITVQGCVTTPKIADQNVTTIKLKDECVINSKIKKNSIENDRLKDLTILGGNKIGESKIAPKTITYFNIANNTLKNINYDYGSVTGYGDNNEKSVIADETITNLNIAINTIDNSRLLDNTIEGNKIAQETISSEHIKDGSLSLTDMDETVSDILNNAVLYERDDENNLCVKLKGQKIDSDYESCYMNISGHLDVVGDITGARVYNMAYSDLAEGYIPGEKLEPGDIVSVCEDGKVYKTTFDYKESIVGVISDEYAACYGATNDELKIGKKVAVALIGKVHVKVKGDIKLGQKIGFPLNPFSEKGIASKINTSGFCIGKALETINKNNFDDINNVLCLIFPN